MKSFFKDWTLFQKVWLLTFTIINIYLYFAWKDTTIGLFASLTGMMCVVLTAKGKISSYYFGLINVILYAYIAYQSKYYGEVMLNALYFLPMQFVGWYMWSKYKDEDKTSDDVVVSSLSNKERITWLIISIVGVIAYGLVLKVIKGSLPFVDATSTVLSVIAMILLVKRVSEQWLLWIIVDVVSVIMWVVAAIKGAGQASMIVMWSAFLVNAIYGYYNWKQLEKKTCRE